MDELIKIYEYGINIDSFNDLDSKREDPVFKKYEHNVKETSKRYISSQRFVFVHSEYIPKDKIGIALTKKTSGIYTWYDCLCACYLTEENDEYAKEILSNYIEDVVLKKENEIAYLKRCLETTK